MIPVNEPVIGDRELELVTDCLKTGWISSAGRYISEFEAGWAAYCGRRHGIAVTNGTVALQLAIAALDLQPGDEVILPTFTIISCAMAIAYAGATPVLVDAEPDTWCLDVAQVEDRITDRTRALMPVHIYGHPVDMSALMTIADRHGLAVIEDAAEAHGAAIRLEATAEGDRWARCGSFGEMSTFSFYANKLVTTGEGGMVLTDDDRLAHRLRLLRNLAFGSARRFRHEELGFNFRMTNVQAAMGVAQLERIGAVVDRKRAIASRYLAGLGEVPHIQLPTERDWARSVYWMFGIVLEEGRSASELADALRTHGVETRPFFLGMHAQPALRDRGWFSGESYPVADALAQRGLYLPSGVGLSDADIDTVIDAVRRSIR